MRALVSLSFARAFPHFSVLGSCSLDNFSEVFSRNSVSEHRK